MLTPLPELIASARAGLRCLDAGASTFLGTAVPLFSRPARLFAALELLPGRFLDFLDPWGNRIEIVGYERTQFTKADHVLHGMGLDGLSKTDKALQELAVKGMRPN